MNKIIKIISKEFHGLNEAALLLGGFAFLSQVLGLIRDRSLAYIVGAGPVLDVYYAAFRIPDFLYISIASLASTTVLMPFLMDRITNNQDNKQVAKKFLNNVFSAYSLFMVLSSMLIVVLMPVLVKYIAPGFSESQIQSLILTSRIMLLSPIFIGLSNLIGTVTQLYKNFLVFSLSPVFYNIGILLGIFLVYPRFGVQGLAVGVVFGAIMHFLIQVPIVIKHDFFPKFTFKINWKEILEVIKISAPRTLALSCNSLAFIVLISMASNLKPGSISLFTFAYNLQSVPVGIIGISYSIAAFPVLVRCFSAKDTDSFLRHIIEAVKQVIFWSLPIMSLFIVLRAQIVRVILGSNSFSWFDTRLTAASVALFVISLVTQGLVLLFVRGYYASGNTKKPLIVNTISSLMVIIFAKVFLFIFIEYPDSLNVIENILRVKKVPGTEMLALPLAFALGSILNFILIWILFAKDFPVCKNFGIIKTVWQTALGALLMGSVSYLSLSVFVNVFNINTGVGIFMQGLISGLVGVFSGLAVLYLLKNKQLLDLIKTLSCKIKKKIVLAPEQPDL